MTAIERVQPTEVVDGVQIDRVAVLKALGLNPTDPKVQALVLTCQQYGLDPVLKHMVLISGNAYITHKGLLHVAHASGQLDGIVLEDQGTHDDGGHWAKVSVYRRDMSRPFTYVGRYPKNGSNKDYGPEMAITRAECMALRRAFDIAAPVQEEQEWAPESATPRTDTGREVSESPREEAVVDGVGGSSVDPLASPEQRQQVADALATLDAEMADEVKVRWKEANLPSFKSVERFLAKHVDPALELIGDVRTATFDQRRRHVMARLTEVYGRDVVADDVRRHLIIREAVGSGEGSTKELSAAELTAVLAFLDKAQADDGAQPELAAS